MYVPTMMTPMVTPVMPMMTTVMTPVMPQVVTPMMPLGYPSYDQSYNYNQQSYGYIQTSLVYNQPLQSYQNHQSYQSHQQLQPKKVQEKRKPPQYQKKQKKPKNSENRTVCKHCGQETGHNIRKKVGCATIAWGLCLFMTTGICCFLPCYCEWCRDIELTCGKCNQVKNVIRSNCC